MVSAKDTFLAHADGSGFDPTVDELRRNLTSVKLETLSKVTNLDENELKVLMPGLYEQIVVTTIQIAAHVGLGVGLALEAIDELESGASISQFSREIRNQMTETGVALKRRHSNQIAKLVAEVEVQRLAWRHNHEFLSWLGFRRGDPRYPVTDRLERLNAFKVQQRLLKSRDTVISLIGLPLSAALEAHDRFMLANRWHLTPSPDHAVERYVWTLLSFQPGASVLLEEARLEHDVMRDQSVGEERIAAQRRKISQAFKSQLAVALEHIPDSARAGAIA